MNNNDMTVDRTQDINEDDHALILSTTPLEFDEI